jgi:site-specific DNA-methyltransferase (adenine-specific)
MKPYYQDDAVTIYHGDCREVLPTLGSVDLVLTDPPYNGKHIGAHSKQYAGRVGPMPEAEYQALCTTWFAQAEKLAPCLLFSSGIANVWRYPPARWMLCWHKPSAVAYNRSGGFNIWEPILLYGKVGNRFGQDYFRHVPPNFSTGPEREHPCPKPLALWKWLVLGASKEGNLILDPFMGSGTTLRAAKDLGRKAIGIEIEERYCEIAAKRMAQAVMDLSSSPAGRATKGE